MIKSLLQTSAMAIVIGMMFSCTEDIEGKSSEFTTDRIVINLTESADDGMTIAKTRSVPDTEKPGDQILSSKSGKKMYLSCTETPWPSAKTATTRGAQVTTAGISNIGVSASVYSSSSSYTSAGCGSYFFKESVASGTPTKFFWPTSDYKISFFGYYPYNNAAFTVQSFASATGAPTYAYTVPSTIADQQDIMTGQVTDLLGGSSSAVNMTLSHRCSAIHFSITNNRSSAITVNSISIEGVKYTGTLNENTWTLSDGVNSSSTNPFTLSYGSAVSAGVTADITGTNNIFMMLPQTLPATAKLKMVVDDEEFETELTGTWQIGKEYTYNITIGEVDTTIDLSMVDNAGNARASMTTANCYMVHAAGDYKLPLVYGNAIKNGATNTASFYTTNSGEYVLSRFINHAGTGITDPWLKNNGATPSSAELLWQDSPGLITEVTVVDDYLYFTVGTFTYGNAVIAVKNSSGTILWSWHIWVTDETYTDLITVATGSHTYRMAPCNLGWEPQGANGKLGISPYYQWGRKDPLSPAQSYNNFSARPVYDISNNTVTPFDNEGLSDVSLSNVVKERIIKPTTFVDNNVNAVNLWHVSNMDLDNVSTATTKSIYDPCPPGFCLPTQNLWYYIIVNGTPREAVSTVSDFSYYCDYDHSIRSIYVTIGGNTVYLPCLGMVNSANYNNGEFCRYSEYYSANLGSPYNAYYARSIRIDTHVDYNPPIYEARYNSRTHSTACSIRPVAEE